MTTPRFETFQHENGPIVILQCGDSVGVWDETAKREALLHAAVFIGEREEKWMVENPSPAVVD